MGAGGCSPRGLRAPPGVRGREGRRPVRASCVQGSRVGVRTPPQGAGAQSRPSRLPGCGAPGGGPWRSPDVRGSADRPHAAALRRRRGTEPTGARRRGPRRGPGRGVPGRCGRRRSAAGPCALRRPLPRGRRTGARGGEPRGGAGVLAPRARGRARSGAPWRGGGEAGERPWLLPPGVPRVTAAAAILPHTDPPPAPADSSVRRHCARGGASPLRGLRGGGCSRAARGGGRVGGGGAARRRQASGVPGCQGPRGSEGPSPTSL
ncbi:LOW QUALITY PROTEIN: collagen alpha-2(I) chain-like [Lutra lutra]|uniref:LOW QUALITY PROTEIN: collagen alpha-2(I) chain-like n=1 Tax=Lutra lutra TaxID=9657 RepID=UPI001FD36918|nr:LOW QUALITY PROTEIN: collagen alpha-2(I) chain-like [Lutra lutra]